MVFEFGEEPASLFKCSVNFKERKRKLNGTYAKSYRIWSINCAKTCNSKSRLSAHCSKTPLLHRRSVILHRPGSTESDVIINIDPDDADSATIYISTCSCGLFVLSGPGRMNLLSVCSVFFNEVTSLKGGQLFVLEVP